MGVPAVLLAGFLFRLWPVLFAPSLNWGDEVYQATEPAHRLIFGYGLVTWEWVAGIRSWLIPGAIAGIMAASTLLGGTAAQYLPAVFVAFALIALVPVWVIIRVTRPLAGAGPALAAGMVVACAPELAYFGARPLSEVVAAHVLAASLLCRPPSWSGLRARPLAAGALLGLAVALRPQITPAVLVVALWKGPDSAWTRAAGFAGVLLAAILLDWVTIGVPGASIWRYTLVNLAGASTAFGTQPWYYYLLAEAAIWGPFLPVPVVLCLLGARTWPMPLASALALVGAHMLIGHKELRFLYPALVLGAMLAGLGLACLSRRHAVLLAGGWVALSALIWFGPAMSVLRHRAQDQLEAADYAATLPGICGIGLGPPGEDAWVPYGGYSHIHQHVPLLWPRNETAFAAEAPGFNLLLSTAAAPGYTALRCFGTVCVQKRSGVCVPIPADAMPARPGVR